MKSPFIIRGHKSRAPAFSLVEMMVSLAVVAVMLTLLNSLVGHVAQTWRSGKVASDNQSKARIALDIIARDLAHSLVNEGLPGFLDSSGRPSLTFHSAQCGPVNGGFSTRPLSLISYRLMDTGEFSQRGLQRAQLGFDFATPPTSAAAFPAQVPATALAAAQYQVIGPGILRMAYCFQSADGSFTETLVCNPATPAACSKSVSVCLLVIDEETLRLLERNSQYAEFLQRFDQAVASNGQAGKKLPLWTETLRDPSLFAGLPRVVAKSLAIYERTVPLPVKTP